VEHFLTWSACIEYCNNLQPRWCTYNIHNTHEFICKNGPWVVHFAGNCNLPEDDSGTTKTCWRMCDI